MSLPRLIWMLCVGLSLHAQVLTFAQQPIGTHKASLWEITVDPCGEKPISSATLRQMATTQGLQPWSSTSATLAFNQKSLWGRLAIAGQVVTTISAGVVNVGFIATNNAWKQAVNALNSGGMIASSIAKSNITVVVPNADQGITITATGCGTAYMYTAPSKMGGFNMALPTQEKTK